MMSKEIKDAVYLIDDNDMYGWGGLRSGWDYFGDGEGPEHGKNFLNSDKDGEVLYRRDVRAFNGGVLTYEGVIDNKSGDGLHIIFGSRDDAFLDLHTVGNVLYAGNTGVCGFDYGRRYIKAVMDMRTGKAKLTVDDKFRGEYDFERTGLDMSCIRIGYGKKDMGACAVAFTKLYVNYLVNDFVRQGITGALPEEYLVASNGAKVETDYRVEGKAALCYFIKAAKNTGAAVSRVFEKSEGKTAFEIKYHTPSKCGRVTLKLKNGSNTLLCVYDDGDALMHGDTLLRSHHVNVWQTMRMEADTRTGKVLVWLNGKKTKVLDFDEPAAFADTFEFSFEGKKAADAMFTDILVWNMPDEPEDYVPAPVIPKKKGDYFVGMNICSLWHEGSHFGWDAITPFDDVKPVLGYYDEGLPETADWEIKFLAEHGVDYELYCWYSSESDAPLKSTGLSYAIHQGHFHAKYADNMKLALLWEAANCAHPNGLEAFKKYLVPYWIDYFFSDPRYASIDNKAIMSCFGVNCVERDLGGEANTREGLQYLRDEVKKLGYDDLIIMGCHANPHDLKRLGFDAFHAYHWGEEGYKLEKNIECNVNNINMNQVHIVPTVSVGFKNVGWGGDRRPNLSCQDMYNGLVYCMDEILPKYEKNSWKSKMLHLSTWNEYGEGTYMMPSGLNGFGYLDAVRKAVCIDTPHKDAVPDEEQLSRICYLHVQSRRKLARTKYDSRPFPAADTLVKKFEFKTKADLDAWTFENMDKVEIKDGKLVGKATEREASMTIRGCGLDCADIAYAKIIISGKPAGGGTALSRFIPSNDGENFDINARFDHWAASTEREQHIIQLDTKPCWRGTINGIKFYPTINPGDFEIESISFFAGVEHTTIYDYDGKQMFFGDYPETKNGKVYVPLDPSSGILRDCRYEWHKDEGILEVTHGEDKLTFTVGKAYAEKNGESFTLARPVYLKDGIPSVSLDEYADLFGYTYEIKGNKVYIKK